MSVSPLSEDFATIEALKTYESEARHWMLEGVSSLLSLWSGAAGSALRHTEDFINSDEFRPTATFQSLVALGECGLWHRDTVYDHKHSILRMPHGQVPCSTQPPRAVDILRRIMSLDTGLLPKDDLDGTWLLRVVDRSSHAQSEEKKPSSRPIIPVERLVSAMRLLLGSTTDQEIEPLVGLIQGGLRAAEGELLGLLTRNGEPLNAAELYESGDFAPAILLNIVTCFEALEACYRRMGTKPERRIQRTKSDVLFKHLHDVTVRNVDYHMARHSIALDPSYDPVSLTFALRALCMLAPTERRFAFFRACIDAIVARQHQDGCWPDGVSITFEPTADVVQQPSVGVALLLAECAIHDYSVSDHVNEERSLLDAVLPALRNTMQYLRATYTTVITTDNLKFTGWSSDRTRRLNYAETWITALATRLLRRLWIGEKAALRNHALTRLGLAEHRGKYRSIVDAQEEWQTLVVDPDSVTKPTEVVWKDIVLPILTKRTAGDVFQRPDRDAVSFIIFGPPGSGKTFFVQSLAHFLGWPLVTITPGHFIHRGLEFIEAVAREIFEYLRLLNHAVVFFDECDELFRSRDEESQRGARSILSFATASMLPKLQDLHDAANVIFILGTNFLRNIDVAVRRPGRFDEILLFDRPDDAARKMLLSRILPDKTDKRMKEFVGRTRGLTVKEVLRIAEREAMGLPWPADDSREDYREWCRRDALAELRASRYDQVRSKQLRSRWSAISPTRSTPRRRLSSGKRRRSR